MKIENLLNFIKESRKAKGYTQENMAEKLGCSNICYHNNETGLDKMSVKRLLQICEILDITIEMKLIYTKTITNGKLNT